jgi:hypothetical protein
VQPRLLAGVFVRAYRSAWELVCPVFVRAYRSVLQHSWVLTVVPMHVQLNHASQPSAARLWGADLQL